MRPLWLVTMFSLTGVHAVADDVLQRLQRTRSKSSIALPADAYIDALTLAGEMYFVRAFGADPIAQPSWGIRQRGSSQKRAIATPCSATLGLEQRGCGARRPGDCRSAHHAPADAG